MAYATLGIRDGYKGRIERPGSIASRAGALGVGDIIPLTQLEESLRQANRQLRIRVKREGDNLVVKYGRWFTFDSQEINFDPLFKYCRTEDFLAKG